MECEHGVTMEEENNRHLEQKRKEEEQIDICRQDSYLMQQLVTAEQYGEAAADILEMNRAKLKELTPKNQAQLKALEVKARSIKETEAKVKQVEREIVNQEEEMSYVEQQIRKCQEYLDGCKMEQMVVGYHPALSLGQPVQGFGLKCRFV